MAWSDPAKIPPVMVAVRAESAMAILFIGGMNANDVEDDDDVISLVVVVMMIGLSSAAAWSEVDVLCLAEDCCLC